MKNQKTKTEVAYFSAEGTTRKMAERLASCLDAGLYEIRPEQDYTQADLDWNNKQSRSTLEMKDHSNRVKIAGDLPDLKDIDVLFLGFPIWWGIAPRIIPSFIEKENLQDKNIVLFATSGGSGIEKAEKELVPLLKNDHIAGAKLLHSWMSEEELLEWVKSLNL